ncbi:response regulator transcription factor [Pseudoalteromonas piscicida]|uniref:DNA-binding response regulator n=1 Tax=Pseudoalteromonas piscicida TaxID=43662 RepID=A0A2A5JNX3_PSEO7|nr:response regulator transcription factor [Pseudoalteromonas piscicida]PCK31136.1 hypothetical protein CEX98_13835 [Pseudoalteromonas piscicida]
MNKKFVVIADDHPMYLEALSLRLQSVAPDITVEAVQNYTELFDLLNKKSSSIDAVIADLLMPHGNGVESVKYLCERFSNVPLLLLSGQDDFVTRQECLDAGAKAFLSKCDDSAVLVEHLKKILKINNSGNTPQQLDALTPTQYRVLSLIAQGLSNKQIASHLGIAEKTVKVHVSAIFEKLNVNNRTQAALLLNK